MNKKLCILLVLAVVCSAAFAGKDKSQEKSKEKSKEDSKEDDGSKQDSNESSSKEVSSTAAPSTTIAASSDRCAGQPDGTLLPSLSACASFITCQGETEGPEATCVPAGTIFDSTRNVCDYEANVLCTVETEATTLSTEATTEATTPGPEPSQNELKAMCKGVIVGMIPHPGNCNKFVICVLGKPSIQSCGNNQIFYKDLKLCAFGDPKKC